MLGFLKNLKEFWSSPDENCTEEDVFENRQQQDLNNSQGSKVVSIHKNNTKIVCFRPCSYDKEILGVAKGILEGCIVVLNLELERSSPDIARRIVDFLRGIVYAKCGMFVLVSENTYVLTPGGVEVSGTEIISEIEHNEVCF
ncbi:MAG: cell division protein SepF [Oscillospiraceae bacterium]|jgi:cell division inhibitor SepF|nr:cell division protein SepF [Oscillospiraceae bacterium]